MIIDMRKPALCKLLLITSVFVTYEPSLEKTRFFAKAKTKAQISFAVTAVTAKLITVFVFAIWILKSSWDSTIPLLHKSKISSL